jgi:hypothetical protein
MRLDLDTSFDDRAHPQSLHDGSTGRLRASSRSRMTARTASTIVMPLAFTSRPSAMHSFDRVP